MLGRRWWVPWLWLMPALVLVGAFLVWPSIDTFLRSLRDARSEEWVGLANYRFIAENPNPTTADTHGALLNNGMWLALFTGIVVPLGLILAVLSGRVRYEAVAKSAIFIPMAISLVAASVIWRFMLEFNADIGTVNAVLGAFGGDPVAWLQDTRAPQQWLTQRGPEQLPGPVQINNVTLILIGVWIWTGFAMVVLSAGLKSISTEVLEAARVDGANEWQVFWRIIIPTLRPAILVVATTLVINALKIFDLIWVTSGGRFGTDVVATLFFKQAFVARNFGIGAALAFILLLAVVPLMTLTIRRFQAEGQGA
ncbi:MAG: sugar ABC transporter permease [Dehalococcoidia bacterium]